MLLIRPADRPGDLGWVVQAHGEQYAREFGWDRTFEALVAQIVADYGTAHDPARERGWIAERDGERVGCVFCVAQDQHTAQLRILLVASTARGGGVGTELVRTCVDFARRAGYRRMVLWTNDVLVAARRIYAASGFRLETEDRHRSFGRDLVGQTWSLDLRPSSRRRTASPVATAPAAAPAPAAPNSPTRAARRPVR
jgi:GNAT superfamily N-acetyltransferase